MKFIEVDGKKFKLASLWKRLLAPVIDVVCCVVFSILLAKLLELWAVIFFHLESYAEEFFWNLMGPIFVINIILILAFSLGACVLSRKRIGTNIMGLKILRFKETQQLDSKFVKTVVVNSKPEEPETEVEMNDPEQIAIDELKERLSQAKQQVEDSIDTLKERVSEAKQQVEDSIGIGKRLQSSYEEATARVEACNTRAVDAIETGHEDSARKELKIRNEERRLAARYKTQHEEQKQVVEHNTRLLQTLEQGAADLYRRQAVILAKYKNAEVETYLREMLKEIQLLDELNERLFIAKQLVKDSILEMKSITIGTETFELAPRGTRLYAFFVGFVKDCVCASIAFIILLILSFQDPGEAIPRVVICILSILAFSFTCFFESSTNGKTMGLQALRLKDGKPLTIRDSFVRRLTGILQPLDLLWLRGKKHQRLGDKFAGTVMVEPEPEKPESEIEDLEKTVEATLVKITDRRSAARVKVEAAIEAEEQFQSSYEAATTQVEACETRITTAMEAGHEDTARKEFEIRNEYRRIAEKQKTDWDQQRQAVLTLRNLHQYLERKIMEAEQQKTVAANQNRNVDIEAALREAIAEIQDNKTVEKLKNIEQEAIELKASAKAAVELDIPYQDVKLASEFSNYAEESSIDKELTELKAKLQK